MAFPPSFTDAWDITQPPDTQAANLLGLDLRNLKNDIMQRLSLLSGTLANRPTPETVNATWGGAGFGILYFATDTRQIFQWSGAAWVEVTANLGAVAKYVDNSVVVVTPASGVLTGNSITIPANTLVPNSIIEFETLIIAKSGVTVATLNWNFGPFTYTGGFVDLSSGNTLVISGKILVTSATTFRGWFSALYQLGGTFVFGGSNAITILAMLGGDLTFNPAIAFPINTFMVSNPVGGNVVFNGLYAKLF